MHPTTTQTAALPEVPLTIEGASTLHQMFRIDWRSWKLLSDEARAEIAAEAKTALAGMEGAGSAMYSMLGHKGDLMLVHFRENFDALNEAELQLARLHLFDYLEPVHSYLSMVELGLYESTDKVYGSLAERGIAPHSEEWNKAVEETLERQRQAMRVRLYPEIPASRYVCFYPMDRRRGEDKNWYTVPMAERKRMMNEHGLVGRRYAGEVRQVIGGSIGFDDWEWAVTLWSDNPLQFKKLIYEMRFDEVSAIYALFGDFFVGIRVPGAEIGNLLEGRLPR